MTDGQVVHVMDYRAGVGGSEPGWRCPCGWRVIAKPMPQRRTGNNKIEARRSYIAHMEAPEASDV